MHRHVTVSLQLAAAAAALKADMFLLRVGSLSIVKVLQGLLVLRGPLVQHSTSGWTDCDHISFQ
jgi:hypothetical protein